jgi:fumarate reductase flavoprotein subunit
MGKSPALLRPVITPPFYAAQFMPSSAGTLGGILISTDLEVLTPRWEVIPGLFAAGSDASAVYGPTYNFEMPGGNVSFAINTGRMAGINAAAFVNGR